MAWCPNCRKAHFSIHTHRCSPPKIVATVNSHAILVEAIQDIIQHSREKFAVERAVKGMRDATGGAR